MITNGTIVTVYEDPITKQKVEGNAVVKGFVQNLQPGLNQYLVHFIGDAANFNVTRIIDESEELICTGKDPVRCDDVDCKVHGAESRAHWVGASSHAQQGGGQ